MFSIAAVYIVKNEHVGRKYINNIDWLKVKPEWKC